MPQGVVEQRWVCPDSFLARMQPEGWADSMHQEGRRWDTGGVWVQLCFAQDLVAGSWGLSQGDITGGENMPGCRKGCVRTASNTAKSQTFLLLRLLLQRGWSFSLPMSML